MLRFKFQFLFCKASNNQFLLSAHLHHPGTKDTIFRSRSPEPRADVGGDSAELRHASQVKMSSEFAAVFHLMPGAGGLRTAAVSPATEGMSVNESWADQRFVFSPLRLDILYDIEMWQRSYKRISYANTKVRSEVRGGGRKPWRQKGSGRARHGSIRSPIWRGGGVSHGPRGPNSYYYMLPMKVRVQGLKVALSSKMSQDYLHIVDSLSIPTPDPQYLLDLVRQRHWGESVLIVDIGEEFPENILRATADLKTVNLIPAIGLNVHSMLKHEVLVLTLETVKFLEEKLLWHDQRYTPLYPFKLPYSDFP
uniref:Large ribosomal subunit protein uL4m n=1 Tax=Monopterus albus TaxID=43700 RepID=A0A3Q3IGB3_MONAL